MWGALATYLLAVFLVPYRGVPLHRALWDHGPEILGLPRPLAYVGGLAGIYIVCLGASILVTRLTKKDDPRWTELSSRATRPGIKVEDLVLGALAAVTLVYAFQQGLPLYGVLTMAVPTITTVLTQLFQSRGKATPQDAPKTEAAGGGELPPPKIDLADLGRVAEAMDREALESSDRLLF